MQIIQGTKSLNAPFSASILTIGNFDGVHKGHQELVRRVVERAEQKGVPSIVMTFEPHPVKVLRPDKKLHKIFDLEDMSLQLEKLGVSHLVIEPFSREFSQLPPERYILEWIFKPYQPETVVVGYDFSFGANRQGSIEFLKEQGSQLGFQVEVVPPVKIGEVLVSSSRIRQAVESGDMVLAEKLLGRYFYVKGLVEKGAGRGRKIGVPTANLRSSAELHPGKGVYAGWASVRGKRWKAAINIGTNPTFTDPQAASISIEAHLLNFPGADGANSDIYGETVSVEFVSRLRDEKRFSSVDTLVEQIKKDLEEAERTLG